MYLTPFLYLFLGIRVREGIAYLTAGIYFLAFGLLIPDPLVLVAGLFLGLLPTLIGVLLKREYFLEDVIMKGLVLSYSSFLLIHYQFRSIFDLDLFSLYLENLTLGLEKLSGSMALDIPAMLQQVRTYYPSFLFIGALITVLILLLSASLLRRFQWVDFRRQSLSSFRFRKMSPFQLLALIILILMIQRMGGSFRHLGANMMVIFIVLFGMQGLSVIYYYLKQRKVPGFFIGLILLWTLIMPFVQQVLGLLGIFDSFADLRKMERAK